VRVDGRDLNLRVRPNVLVNGQRLLAGVNIQPRNSSFRTALSKGSSRYDGLILAFRRRLSQGFDVSASYTLAKATSDVGTASDEIVQNLIQDIRDPFGPVQQGPSARTDSRHMVSISGIVRAPWNIQVAPIFYYRSAFSRAYVRGQRLEPGRHEQRSDGIAVSVYGDWQRQPCDVRGGRRLRHGELQPACRVFAAEPARQPRVSNRARHPRRSHLRSLQTCSKRRILRWPSRSSA
jgi:hypothetical protein